jgi:hypothetical protein
MHWEGLAVGDGDVADEAGRTAYYQQKVRAIAAAQRDGILAEDPEAAHLLFLILALAAWWFAVPQVARMLTGSQSDSATEHARRRAAVVQAARRLARGHAAAHDGEAHEQSWLPTG